MNFHDAFIDELFKLAALAAPCQTPEAHYSTSIKPKNISVAVKLPHALKLTKSEASALERRLHNSIETVLAVYFLK